MKNRNKIAGIIIFIAIILMVIGSSVASVDKNKLNATDNISEAQQIATQQNKHVFIVFKNDACMWCDILEADTLSDERVLSELDEKYVVAIVDVEKQPEVAKTFNAIGTPIMVLMDSNGTEQERLNGYYGPNELLEYL